MFRIFKLFSFGTFIAIGALAYTNTNMRDFKVEGKRILDAEQSALRAGWTAVAKVTGINAVSRAVGLGNYELCRKNLFIGSVYRVTNDQLLEDSYPVAIGIGAARKVWIYHSKSDAEDQPFWFSKAAGALSALQFAECERVHNPGEL